MKYRYFIIIIICTVLLCANVVSADFDPSTLPNLQLWLKADAGATTDGVTPAADGDLVRNWTDQSGNGNSATQDTSANRPIFKTNIFNTKPALRFSGSQFATTTAFLDATYNTAFTFFIVANKTANDTTLELTTSNNGLAWFTGREGRLSYWTSNLSDNQIIKNGPALDLAVESFSYNGSTKILRYNSTSSTTESTTGNLGLSGALTIGKYEGGGYDYHGDIAEILIYKRTLSGAEMLQVENYLKTKYGVVSPTNPQIVFVGDSLTSGVGSTGGQTYPKQTVDLLSTTTTYDYTNLGVMAWTVTNMTDSAPSGSDGHYNDLRPNNLLAFWGGTNDIFYGADATTAYNRIVSYAQGRKTLGYKVIVTTMLPRGADVEGSRTSLNSLLRANWSTFADALSDPASDSRIGDAGDFSDTTYYSDGVHMTNAGYAIVASFMKHQIELLTDITAPTISITSPIEESSVSGTINITANSSDNVGVVGVQFKLDSNTNIGTEDTNAPYSTSLDTTTISDGAHTITAISRDATSNSTTSSVINITVANIVAPVIRQSGRPILLPKIPQPNTPNLPNILNTSTEIQNTTKLFKPTLNLKEGQTNSQIKILQQYLNSNGFIVAKNGVGSNGKETNYFGPLTKAALKKFQKSKGIKPASGYFGPKTKNYINSH